MNKIVFAIFAIASAVACAAPTVSYPVATNIADGVTRKVVTKQFVQGLGLDKDISFDTNRVEQIATEIAVSVADGTIGPATNGLAEAIAGEKAAREAGDAALGAEVNAKLNADAFNAFKTQNDNVLTSLFSRVDGKQNALVSGQSIKTINGQSVLGGGNISIQSGIDTNAVEDIARDVAHEVTDPVHTIVTTWEQFLDGSNVVFSITNYISGTYNLGAAKLRILELRDGEYHEVYNSRDEINLHIADFETNRFLVGFNNFSNNLTRIVDTKGDRAWGNRSSTGKEVPISNTVWVTEQNLRIAGGMEYERVAVGEGAVYVLASKGMNPYMQGEEGSLMLHDDGGTNYFGMARSDSYTVGCNTDGIRTAGNLVYLDYNVTMSDHPCIWYKPTLENYENTEWEQLNLPDGSPVPGASHQVVWDDSPRLGAQECYINVGNAPSGFFRATIEVAGDCEFRTNMKANLMGGIKCENTASGLTGVIRPTYNGSSVTWTWSEN